jgi:hypothetical protein
VNAPEASLQAKPTMIFREKALAVEEDWQNHMVNRTTENSRL